MKTGAMEESVSAVNETTRVPMFDVKYIGQFGMKTKDKLMAYMSTEHPQIAAAFKGTLPQEMWSLEDPGYELMWASAPARVTAGTADREPIDIGLMRRIITSRTTEADTDKLIARGKKVFAAAITRSSSSTETGPGAAAVFATPAKRTAPAEETEEDKQLRISDNRERMKETRRSHQRYFDSCRTAFAAVEAHMTASTKLYFENLPEYVEAHNRRDAVRIWHIIDHECNTGGRGKDPMQVAGAIRHWEKVLEDLKLEEEGEHGAFDEMFARVVGICKQVGSQKQDDLIAMQYLQALDDRFENIKEQLLLNNSSLSLEQVREIARRQFDRVVSNTFVSVKKAKTDGTELRYGMYGRAELTPGKASTDPRAGECHEWLNHGACRFMDTTGCRFRHVGNGGQNGGGAGHAYGPGGRGQYGSGRGGRGGRGGAGRGYVASKISGGSSERCLQLFLYGKCNRANCKYDHNFTVETGGGSNN